MSAVDVLAREDRSTRAGHGASASQPGRAPPKAVKLLLPAWGYRYVRQFLDHCLPTLLAPGNVPALAAALPCEFVLLTCLEDAAEVKKHAAWHRLCAVCSARIGLIDDLVFDRSHAITITGAYVRAVRATAGAMRDTCFIFLAADFVLADGALASVLARVAGGANAVLAGNFQAVAEDIAPALQQRADGSGAVSIPPRDLLRLGLSHMHPASALDVVGGVAHQQQQNRLFWRVDGDTLIGRFYLMHMIAIRPEVSDFEISSACDYSFIPEMCPSNNVAVVTDSDEYLAIELQPRTAMPANVGWGRIEPREIAGRLSQWTTQRHRENAANAVVFHAAAIPAATAGVIAEADAFIAETARHLSREPQPHRHHPYWQGGLARQRALGPGTHGDSEAQAAKGAGRGSLLGFLWRLRLTGLGAPPNVRPWHPRWPDFRLPAAALARRLGEAQAHILVVSRSPETFRTWRPTANSVVTTLDTERLASGAAGAPSTVAAYDACVVVQSAEPEKASSAALERIPSLLKPDAPLLVLVTKHARDDPDVLSLEQAGSVSSLVNAADLAIEPQFVRAGWLRRMVQEAILRLARAARDRGALHAVLAAVLLGLLLPVSAACNWSALRSVGRSPRRAPCSSLMLTLRRRGAAAAEAHPPRMDAWSRRPKSATPAGRRLQQNLRMSLRKTLTARLATQQEPLRAPPRRHTPPKEIRLLLPVWGYRFVRAFLEQGLPTLLAPGNVPALAAALPCRFVIMTSYEDAPYLRVHPAFGRLCETCEVEIKYIDHLITGTNYSTTITLAYTEQVRAAGDAITDTCFFFLVSDYIMADGSLANILKRMMAGTSGVLVGNFQVVFEDALPWLQEQLNRSPLALSLSARELMRWGLSHLHPTVIANTVNHRLSHNNHTNRLFWRADGNSIIGRFYLMHMICIRPELAEFTIGAACDYSFIPEMCPSGNVDVVTDSDEYLVVEMQPRAHEAKFLRPGPLKLARLAKTLSEWTTERHRENAQNSVVFHVGDVSERIGKTIAEADRYVGLLAQQMKRKAKPHRDHPYWRGALASYHEATGQKLNLDEWRLVLGLPDPATHESWISDWLVEQLRFAMFGRPPSVRRWHPRWADYHQVIKKLGPFLRERSKRLLMISDAPTVFTASLADSGEKVVRIRTGPFLLNPAEVYEAMAAQFDQCLLELTEGELAKADELIDRVAPLMKPGGEILVAVNNRRGSSREAMGFGASISFHAPRLLRPAAEISEVHFVPASQFRWAVFRTMMELGSAAQKNPVTGIPMLMIAGWFLGVGCLLANLLSSGTRKTPPRGLASSVLFVLKVSGEIARDAYKYSATRIIRQRQRRRRGIDDAKHHEAVLGAARALPAGSRLQGVASPGGPASTRLHETTKGLIAALDTTALETHGLRSERVLELKREIGLATLGLTSNQIWHDDPRGLVFLLSRYKFVAKMLKGRRFVGEVGCGDAFGTRIVLQEVEQVAVYDFDPRLIEDVRQRRSERWPIDAYVHDIVTDVLPNRHDAIYSLDLIQRMRRDDEHAYLANLRDSLEPDGVLMIGTPSAEAQVYSSLNGGDHAHNCKSGDELKALLERYFDRCFIFSMNDEVVHTGFYPMAHYLFAVCTGARAAKLAGTAKAETPGAQAAEAGERASKVAGG
jgi:SAM-dependent methyltransferase